LQVSITTLLSCIYISYSKTMKLLLKNKRAYFDYDIQQFWEAWIVLLWHEVKSIKSKFVSINEALVRVIDGRVVITNMNVALYPKTTPAIAWDYTTTRYRYLLLHKEQIAKLVASTTKTWLHLLLLQLYIDEKWRVKATIGLWKIRRKVEKKQILKEKDTDRQAKKEIRHLWM